MRALWYSLNIFLAATGTKTVTTSNAENFNASVEQFSVNNQLISISLSIGMGNETLWAMRKQQQMQIEEVVSKVQVTNVPNSCQ